MLKILSQNQLYVVVQSKFDRLNLVWQVCTTLLFILIWAMFGKAKKLVYSE